MKSPKGQVLIIVNALMTILLIYSMALVNLAMSARQTEKQLDLKTISQNIAEAGIQKAIWCLNQTEGSNCGGTYGSNYAGENDLSFNDGILDISITTIDGTTKSIESSAYYPDKITTVGKSIIKSKAIISSDKASFSYGLQVGQGGIKMDNNVRINGSVYSHGNIEGNNGVTITGDAYIAGGTALLADQDYETYNSDFIFGKNNPQIDIAQSFIPNTSDVLNKVSLYIKKISSPSNLKVRIVRDDGGVPNVDDITYATLNTSIVSTNYGWIDVAFNNPPSLLAGTTYWIVLDSSRDSNKYWKIGVDAFDGYTNGTMLYSEDWDNNEWYASGNDINFKIWLGGIETGIDSVTVNGNIYAHNITNVTSLGDVEGYNITNSTIGGNALSNYITNSTIGKNATTTDIVNSTVGYNLWCETKSSTTVGWTAYCPTTITPPSDPGPTNLSISDALIEDWKTDAENGGIIVGDYTVSSNQTLGPKKIEGNLTIVGGKTLTIAGTLYITGSITANAGAIINLNSSYGNGSGILISDGNMIYHNNVILSGADTGSYLLVISLLNSPTTKAISIDNNVNGALFYAPNGIIDLENNATVKQVTAYELELEENVILNYEQGLADITFSSGPSGGWITLPNSWVLIE